MTLTIGTSGGNKTVTAITIGTSGGNKAVQVGYIGTSGGNKVFFSALTPTITPGSQTDSAASSINTFATEGYSLSGGIGPYTQVWSLSSISGGSWSFLSGTTNTTCDVQVTGVGLGVTRTATLNLAVTDTSTGVVANASCALSFEHTP